MSIRSMGNGNVKTFEDANFEAEVIKSDKPVLVDFWAPWCGPCKAIAPSVEALASEYDGKAAIGKLNIDECPETTQKYNIRSIPTLLLFKDGAVVDQLVGGVPKARIEEMIKSGL